MRVLISGASIAGPVLAYWLTRRGFEVTVVERAPALRKAGGHAVDLFRPAMEISEQMGVLPRIRAHATGIETLAVHRRGAARSIRIDLRKAVAAGSDRHVEVMRDDLSQIYYDAGRDHVEYLFGDEITAIADDGNVTFGRAGSRPFDLIVGADGLHSGVRRLTFGDEAALTTFLGAYLAVVSVPKTLARQGESLAFVDVGRMAAVYTADNIDDARAIFMFRSAEPLSCHHRDVAGQQEALRTQFAGFAPEIDDWLAELDRTPAFYFDSITQLQLTGWTRGPVTLVGDAAYCPGPAVGGSTSLAVLGAYVLAGELERAGSDLAAGCRAYEHAMTQPVADSRAFARAMAQRFVPRSRWGVHGLVGAGRLLSTLPTPVTKLLMRLNDKGIGLFDSMQVPDYPLPVS